MAGFDLMTKGGTVARAADTCTYNVGVRDGRIAGMVQNLAQNFESGAAGGHRVDGGGGHARAERDGKVRASATATPGF
jgi:hypothetical protein